MLGRPHEVRSKGLSGIGRKVRADKSASMKDYQASIEKLRKDSAEAALIRDLAMDAAKREMFDRLHQHLNRLADEVEAAMKSNKAK
jgi:hypothetical protein